MHLRLTHYCSSPWLTPGVGVPTASFTHCKTKSENNTHHNRRWAASAEQEVVHQDLQALQRARQGCMGGQVSALLRQAGQLTHLLSLWVHVRDGGKP